MPDSRVLLQNTWGAEQYIWQLQATLDAGFRLWDPDFALAQDPAAPEKMRRHPLIVQGLDIRFNKVAAKKWQIEPYSERDDDVAAAAIVEDLFREIASFRTARKNLANAIFDGRTAAFVEGERDIRQPGAEEQEREWWAPTRFWDKDGRNFRYVPIQNNEGIVVQKKARLEVYDYNLRDWKPVKGDLARQLVFVTFEDRESRLGYGKGLREACYHYYWIETVVTREGLQGLERWANGLGIAKIDSTRHGSESQTPAQVSEDWLLMLRKHRTRFGAVAVDKEDDYEHLWPSGTGHEMVEAWINRTQEALTRLLTGSLLPAGGGADVGSNARAQEEGETSEGLIDYDRGVVDEAITKGAVALTWQANRENFAEAGLGTARMPKFRTVGAKKEDPEAEARLVGLMLENGMPVVKRDAYERVGHSMPQDDDDVLEPREPSASGFDDLLEFGRRLRAKSR